MSEERLFICGFNGFCQLNFLTKYKEDDSASPSNDNGNESSGLYTISQPKELRETSFLKLELTWSSAIILKNRQERNSFIQVHGCIASQIKDNFKALTIILDKECKPTIVELTNNQMQCSCHFDNYAEYNINISKGDNGSELDACVKDLYANGNTLCFLFKENGQKTTEVKQLSDSIGDNLNENGKVEVNQNDVCCVGFGDCHLVFMMQTGDIFSCEKWHSSSNLQQPKQDIQYKIHQLRISPSFQIKSISCGKEHCLLLTENGLVLGFGYGSRGQLGLGSADKQEHPCIVECLEPLKIVSIAAGGWHSLALAESGDIYAWGWNESGQLGIGNPKEESNMPDMPEDNNFIPVCQMFPRLLQLNPDVEFILLSCGSRHSAAVSKTGELWTWGWNQYGQLGHGDKNTRYQPKLVEYFVNILVKVHRVECRSWNTLVYCK